MREATRAQLTRPDEASKHAVAAWSRSLRMELEPFGTNVVAIEPGAVATGIFDSTGLQRTAPYVRARRMAAADPYHNLHDDIGRVLSSQLDDAADSRKCAECVPARDCADHSDASSTSFSARA